MEAIMRIRKARGLTRNDLARLIGVDRETIARYERGTREPKASVVSQLAAALNVTPNELLGVGDETGSFSLDRLFLLDEGAVTPEERRLRLSYPYARQLGDRLYICYSYESAPGTGGNHNDAMLTVVNLCDL